MQISQTAEDVAGEVRAWMGRRRRSGRSVAAELNWTEVYLSRRLSGRVPFDVTDLAALAELLGVPVTAFFEVAEGLRRAPILVASRFVPRFEEFPDPAADDLCTGCRQNDHCDGAETLCCCTCGWDEDWAEQPLDLCRSGLGLAA